MLIVSRGLEEKHRKHVFSCLRRLDEEYLNIRKCHFAKLENNWLGYHISQSGILLIESKTSAILSLEALKTVKKLCSFLGSVHYISKYISNPVQISHPIRPLSQKSTTVIWTDTHENGFPEIKKRIKEETENCFINLKSKNGPNLTLHVPGMMLL